jgi:hypothetical protein
MSKQAKATATAPAAPAAATYQLSATGVALAAKAGNNTRQTVTAPATTPTGATVWRNTKTGRHAAGNTRAAACAAMPAAPFTAAAALGALAPLQASGALGAGSTASGYWAWLVRVGHVVAG